MLILAGFAVPAAAQNSTTNCQTDYFGNVTCRTTQDPAIDWRLGQQRTPNAGDSFLQGWRQAQDRAQQLPQPPRRPTAEQTQAQICVEELEKAKASGNEEQLASIRRICSP